MKFSEIEQNEWQDHKAYFDTCLLPITGLSGNEMPWEATSALEKLQQMMDLLEIPFKGRIVTYPSFHYTPDRDKLSEQINEICIRLKRAGFQYVILVTADTALSSLKVPEADLLISPENVPDEYSEAKRIIAAQIGELWAVS